MFIDELSAPVRAAALSVFGDVVTPAPGAVVERSTAALVVSPCDVPGWPWSGRVLVASLPRVDSPVLVSGTPDLDWLALAESEMPAAVVSRAAPTVSSVLFLAQARPPT